ncbi:MAG: alpha/beta-hydrolase family protein [Acuticoccus sp.]
MNHDDEPAPFAHRARLVSGFGIFAGLALFAASLTPSLVPRVALVQGLLGGALFAFGYLLSVAALALWRWLGLPEPRRSLANTLAVLAALAGVALAAIALSKAAEWQNSIRVLMDLPPVDTTHPTEVALIALVTGLGLLLVALLVRFVFRRLTAPIRRVVPERVAVIAGLLAAFVLFWALVEGVLVRFTLHTLDQSYAALDALFEPDIDAPTQAWRTGSPASHVDWDDLGRAGRRFVARAPTGAEIGKFWQTSAQEPLRVYVGLGTSPDPDERADLALAELKRVGGFQRRVLVIAVPTGTGYMEEGAIAPLEYLFKGDVATVATQYSYLQSPFSLIFEPGYGADSARALLRAVYEHWTALPASDRPTLYLQGVSLGALSSERSLRLYEVLADPINGAVWSGPPFPSPTHRSATEEREDGSPPWLPLLGDGRFIRFTRDGSNLNRDDPWGPMRILYIQHPSDPIVFFDLATLWRAPEWLVKERGPDVSAQMRWYPVVTALQVAADMALSNDAPPGHGHQYAPETYIDAWEVVAEPPVSPADIERLKALFADGIPGSEGPANP